MARLIVEAIVSNNITRAGTTDPANLTVSVTRANGTPVSNLTQADFLVGDTFGAHRVDISLFQGGTLQIGLGAINGEGLYMLQLVPITGGVWATYTTYHLVVIIKKGNDHGQTIVDLTIAKP